MNTPSSPDFLAPRVLRRAGAVLVTIGAATVAACDDPYAHEAVRVVGAWNGQAQIPDTMTAGVPSEIVIWTHGGGCVTRGETEVDIAGRSALVIPYDYLGSEEASCGILPLLTFKHRAHVVFDDPGTAEITIAYSSDGWYLRRYGYWVYTVEVVQ